MHAARRRPQYLDTLLLAHLGGFASASVQSARRPWWLIVGLTLTVAFLFSLALADGAIR